ncbi:DUF2851 family protein [Compostibacter hankyongensis]|uniref:DUF2851 family protein n=1 Tax=Compostibacter hankyongensis TaxID=1007089 RepID=A0ABP8FVT3_9BACT
MLLSEKLLQYCWRYRHYNARSLCTAAGAPVEVIQPGLPNTDAGPDFMQARIRIGDAVLAGHVEIHLKASDWYRHRHGQDPAYGNVILHVVWENDRPVTELEEKGIPALELRDRIPGLLLEKYERLMEHPGFVPCSAQLGQVDEQVWLGWKERLVIERQEVKTELLERWLEETANDWETVFYRALGRSLGGPVNGDALEGVCRALPLKILARHRDQLLQLEALFFGQAGLLEAKFSDAYPRQLQQEYRFLQRKYSLLPVSGYYWKWLRMRPSAFPSLRIAQLAMLMYTTDHLFSGMLEAGTAARLEQLLSVQAGGYWDTHYRFDQLSPRREKKLGLTSVRMLIINTVVPMLVLYGRLKGMDRYTEKALALLQVLPAEQNRITRRWQELGVTHRCASDSQALLHLKKHYCDERRCLDCRIGIRLIHEP